MKAFWSVGGESVILAGRGRLLQLSKKQARALAKELLREKKPRRGRPSGEGGR